MTVISKRTFLQAGVVAGLASCGIQKEASLPNLAVNATPISSEEHQSRIAKAQRLMRENGVDALFIEAGSAMTYFTGIRWWRSERTTGVVIPATGDIAIVTPYFEEPSIREQMAFGEDVRTWHEHESPFDLIAGILRDRKATGPVAVEETVRYFIVDGISKASPDNSLISGAPITRGCRMIKSPTEIALMQTANDITLAAYHHVYSKIEIGMTPLDITQLMNKATREGGGVVQFSLALLGEASAYPHGTNEPQEVREGDVILMDCGCSVHDYESDISRSWVFGEPSAKQRKVWETVKKGQELALETARVGVEAGAVDDAVRKFYELEGYGPDYKTPGLSHRLGHGIGMDGHEPINFVRGETTKLAPGMCLSNEPGIYIFGEFGIRLEDCLYMTEDGPRLFSGLSPSIDDPIG